MYLSTSLRPPHFPQFSYFNSRFNTGKMELRLHKFAPSAGLEPFIKFYYYITSTPGKKNVALDNHPQGAIDLMFPLQGDVGYGRAQHTPEIYKRVFLVGQQDGHFNFTFGPKMKVLGVTFTPEGFAKIFPVPTKEFTNTGVYFDDVTSSEDRFLFEKIQEIRDDNARLHMLDEYFHLKIYQNDIPFDPVDHAIQAIRQSAGQLSIAELADEYSMSLRTLQRKFAQNLGVSPKTYARVMRFNQVMLLLKQAPDADWQDILYQCGYYDQMHFIKEFKKMTGKPPERYRKHNNKLGDFFVGD